MPLDCNCKAITQAHTQAAQGRCPAPQTTDELYAAALAIKLDDPDAKFTGLESKNGTGFNCGRCRHVFDAAVNVQIVTPKPVEMPVIMMRMITDASAAKPPRIGECGKDCNTCAPKVVEAAGCQPVAL